ncbi:MAG: hypothetical protein HKN68_10895 [Saprospiraceae bacterium]|nr:hypothetical protein [Saprospiraceae bacterium]
MLAPLSIYSQDSEDEPEEKKDVRMSLDFHRINNNQLRLIARIRTKVGRSYVPVDRVNIGFYKNEVSEENLIGTSESKENGEVKIDFEGVADSSLWDNYIAVLTNNPDYNDEEEEVEVLRSIMEIEVSEIDSLRMVEVYVGSLDSSGVPVPAEEVEVRLFVERLFGLLPIGEGDYTDESGKIEFEFPMDLPGDENGMLTIVAGVEDHEDFGNLMLIEEIKWGVPISLEEEKAPDIWLASPTSNASIVLVITTNILLLIIYGVIGYMIYLLMKIRKIGKIHSQPVI